MARKDVELVIRAKDEAAKVVDAITKALNSFVDAQGNLQAQSDKSGTALSRLGAAVGDLDKQLKGANAGDRIAKSLDNATKAAERLDKAVVETTKELADLKARSVEAADATAKLNEQVAKTATAVEREAAALAKAKAAVASQGASLKTAVADRQKLIDADARLTQQISEQQAVLDKLKARYLSLGAEIAKTATPSAALVTALEKINVAGEKQAGKLDELKTTQGSVREAIGQTSVAITRFTNDLEASNQAFARQEKSLSGIKTEYTALVAATRAAQQQEKSLNAAAAETADSLANQQAAVVKTAEEMTLLSAKAAEADVALGRLATGSTKALQAAFDASRRSMLETRREWVAMTAEAKALADSMTKIGPPTREQAVAFNAATTAARAAKAEYSEQKIGLQQLSAILQQTGGDVDTLRAREQEFVAVQAQVTASVAKIKTEAVQSAAAYEKLAGAANTAGKATRGVAGPGSTPPVAPVNSLAEAYRALYGNSRQALSITQRLRGEVLSLVAAYGGLFGVINTLDKVIDAYKTLEAANSRLGAVFNQNQTKTADELDFLRRNADRLGVQFGVLAGEYASFAAATKGTNLEGQKTRDIFLAVAEAARVNKLSIEDVQGVFKALTQIASKGRIQLEELSGQLGDRLPGALQIMADGLGITTAELLKMTKQGEITSDQLVGFGQELVRRFGPQLEASLKTTTTALGQFGNAAFRALLKFADAGFIESFTKLVRELTTVLKSASFDAFIQHLSAATAALVEVLRVLVHNFDLVVIAASAFAGVKIVPFVLAMVTGFKNLRVALIATAAVFTETNTAMAASGAAASVASVAFGRLAIAFRALFSTTGIGLLVTAIAVGIGIWATRADTATEAMNAHEKIVDQVKDAYDAAKGSADKFAASLKNVSVLQATRNLEQLQETLDALKNAPVPNLQTTRADAINPSSEIRDQKAALRALNEEWRSGQIDAEKYRQEVDKIGKSSASDVIKAIATAMLDASDGATSAEEKIAKTQAIIKLLEDPTDKAAQAVLGLGKAMDEASGSAAAGEVQLSKYNDAIDTLKKAIPELADELKKLKELAAIDTAFKAAINSARSIGQANQAFALRDQAISAIDQKGFDDANKALLGFTDGLEASAALLRQQERFQPTGKFDVNAFRAGFGSDTVTLSDGSIHKITEGMRVSVVDANRDLVRRIGEFQGTVKGQIGTDTFAQFNAQQQAVLTSIAYNFGKLPDSIVKAIKEGGDSKTIADAIRALAPLNNGVNARRRGQEASLFEGNSQDAIDAQLKTAEKLAETADKQKAATTDTIAGQQQEIEQQKLINDGKAREAEIEKAIAAAKKENPNITDAEIAKIREQTGLLFDLKNVKKESKEQEKEALAVMQQINALLAQQTQLQTQLSLAKKAGDSGKITETESAIADVNKQLEEAIAKARAMWEAIGGAGAATNLTKLDTASLKIQNFADKAKQTYVDWSRVSQLFADGLTNAFDQFAQAVANGENAADAAKKAFLQFASDFLRQIAQMIIKQAILNALQGAFGSGGLGSLFGGLFHTGGVVGRGGGAVRSIDPRVFNGAQRYHTGGIAGLGPNEVPAILKRNEEVLTQDDPRHILNGGGASAAGGPADGGTRIINAFDTESFIEAALGGKVGERAFLNFVRANPNALKQALG